MTRRIGAFTPEAARRVLDAIETLERSGLLDRNRRHTVPLRPQDAAFPPLNFRNDSGEEVPAYACMEVSGTVAIAGKTYFTIVKPTSDVTSKPVLFNLHNPVDEDGYGIADAGAEVRSLVANTSAATGTKFAPASGSWQMSEDNSGAWMFCGPDEQDSDGGRLVLVGGGGGGESVGGFALAQVTEEISRRVDANVGSGKVQVIRRNASLIENDTDIGEITVYNGFTSNVVVLQFVYVSQDAQGDWWVHSENCTNSEY